jgi:stage II sporulation protein D
MRCSLLALLFLSQLLLAQEQPVRIGIQPDRSIKSVLVMSAKGNCNVIADGQKVGEIQANDGLRIEWANGVLSARSLSLTFQAREHIRIVPRVVGGGVRLGGQDPKLPEREYPGTIEVLRQGGTMRLFNSVGLEDYVAGVVQAEAGNHHHAEYYKLQSVSCRTYALSNLRKHAHEGFQLCDGVHCQVYHGRVRNDSIRMAVDATHGLVLVDADIQLIHATFHSNCGGETVNAEDLWSRSTTYLRATTDTFCREAPQAHWEKTIPRAEWLAFLKRRFGYKADSEESLRRVLEYQPACRDLYLGNTWPLIPLKLVREELKLRSTFFSVSTEGDLVKLRGRGFGHGVGLCQEGSMRMAKAGRSYTEILHHYYTDVHLVDLHMLDFFRAEEPAPVPASMGPNAPSGR